jgi:hypothetical protein
VTAAEWLDALDQAHAAATPGPWISDSHELYQAIPGLPDISGDWLGETCRIEGDPHHATSDADAALIVAAVNALPGLTAALRAVLALADEWRYKGEYGWGPWQAGEGPEIEGAVLDDASHRLRAAVCAALGVETTGAGQ